MPDASASRLLLRDVRPWGRDAVDVLIEAGRIARIGSGIEPPDPEIPCLDGRGELLLPGLVNAHAHIDKTLLGRSWHRNELTGRRIADLVAYEREVHAELDVSAEEQSARQVDDIVKKGVKNRNHKQSQY